MKVLSTSPFFRYKSSQSGDHIFAPVCDRGMTGLLVLHVALCQAYHPGRGFFGSSMNIISILSNNS